jgi:GxxExxY protein
MLLHQETTDIIIKCFYQLYNTLGYGFLEKVYENALTIELRNNNLNCATQFSIPVFYDHAVVGNYFADILVDNKVIIEVKSCEAFCDEHEVQLLNYLKATNFEVGLLLNFGKKPEFKRKVFGNDNK